MQTSYLWVVLFALPVAGAVAASEDKVADALPRDTISAMVRATSVEDLERIQAAAPCRNAALAVVHAARRYELRPDVESQDDVIRAIPKNAVEFDLVYSITKTVVDGEGDPASSDLVYGYIEYLAKAVASRGKGHRELLMLNRFADGEMLDIVQDWTAFVMRTDRERFLKAFRTVDEDTQRCFCGERDDDICRNARRK